jgi:hypothetical protein
LVFPHSLRVGACAILHAVGFTDVQIMWLLRWRSNAFLHAVGFKDVQIMWLLRWRSNTFMTYPRNVAVLSHRQNLAFSDVEAMPHVI